MAQDRSQLPDYAGELAAFHRAFAAELAALVATLPLAAGMRVLDVGCGDGFYTGLLASRLVSPGGIVGLDSNEACLEVARDRLAGRDVHCDIAFVAGTLDNAPLERSAFDFVWCAQSLYSLPDPAAALGQIAAAVRPGGIVAIFENDTLHQILLPWPERLEIALRTAEYAALAEESPRPARYYIGRRLPALLAAAGLEPVSFRTQSIDRHAPLDDALESFLQAYLARLGTRVVPRLERSFAHELERLIDPRDGNYLLKQPHFTMSWLNVLACGRRPVRCENPGNRL